MDFIKHLVQQRKWSIETFGPGERTEGLIDHMQKELEEIRGNPNDIEEWIDVVILALDGAWRVGYSPVEIADALRLKQAKNEQRAWPDWREAEAGKAIEHIKSTDIRGADIKRSHWHDAGAYGRCSYCGRYSDDSCCLNDEYKCDCGKKNGFSGSFKKPTKDCLWHGKTKKIYPTEKLQVNKESSLSKAINILKEICTDIGCSGMDPDMCNNHPYKCGIIKKVIRR